MSNYANVLKLLAAEDERQAKLHELLETIREQIRIGVAPEHRPEGLFKNIQDAVYTMRGRMPLLNDAAIVGVLDDRHAQGQAECACSRAGFLGSCYNCDVEAGDIVNALRNLYATHPICQQAANYIERHAEGRPTEIDIAKAIDDATAISMGAWCPSVFSGFSHERFLAAAKAVSRLYAGCASPAVSASNHFHDALVSLGRANIGSCKCCVKSDHPQFHDQQDCPFPLLEKAIYYTRQAALKAGASIYLSQKEAELAGRSQPATSPAESDEIRRLRIDNARLRDENFLLRRSSQPETGADTSWEDRGKSITRIVIRKPTEEPRG